MPQTSPAFGQRSVVFDLTARAKRRHAPVDKGFNLIGFGLIFKHLSDGDFGHFRRDAARSQVIENAPAPETVVLGPVDGEVLREPKVVQVPDVFQSHYGSLDISLPHGAQAQPRGQFFGSERTPPQALHGIFEEFLRLQFFGGFTGAHVL